MTELQLLNETTTRFADFDYAELVQAGRAFVKADCPNVVFCGLIDLVFDKYGETAAEQFVDEIYD